MTTTRRQRQILVAAVQTAVLVLDEMKWADPAVLEQYDPYDDRHIGGEARREFARILRQCRLNPFFRAEFRFEVQRLMRRMAKNPRQWHVGRPRRRYVATTVTRKARPAKHHVDCMYCGTGWAGEVVCGACREAGIDGAVIRGTEAAKATTFTRWTAR